MSSWRHGIAAALGIAAASFRVASAQKAPGADSALVRELVAEARSALAAAPQPGDEGVAKLVSLQVQNGDLEGARETARRVAHTWVPFAYIGNKQLAAGDLPGAVQTANLAPTMEDRSQALGYLASGFAYTKKMDTALSLARTIVWPRERVGQITLVASLLGADDTLRARQLLREAVGIAQSDTSFWGRYFEVELAYYQASTGDLKGALRVLSDTLPLEERLERLGRITNELQRAPGARSRQIADSLFRATLNSADAIADTAKRGILRARVRWLYSTYLAPSQTGIYQAQSQNREELIDALSARLTSSDDATNPMEALARLEALGDYHRAVLGLETRLGRLRPFSGNANIADRAKADTLTRRILADARMVSAPFVDTTRARIVEPMARLNFVSARAIADSIHDAALRSATLAKGASQWLWDKVDSALAFAESAGPSAARDDFYAGAAEHLAPRRMGEVSAVLRRIESGPRRAIAMVAVASLIARTDSATATSMYAEALPILDPLGRGFEEDRLRPLYALGGGRQLADWARAQPRPQARAAACLAALRAMIPGR